MTFVWLWTDFLLWVMFALSMFAVVKIRGNELLLQKWKKIFAQPLALSAFIVFSFYILIGLSDSIHFRLDNNTTTYSMLDRVLLPALEAEEKTYSTPLNFEQFSKEYLDNGLRGRVHLNLVSDEITNASDNTKNLLSISANALLYAAVIFTTLILVLLKFTLINISHNRSVLATIFALLFICVWVVLLMPNYHILGTDKAGIDVFLQSR